MKAKEIFNYLIKNAFYKQESTCDGIIAGNSEKDVKKVVVCFKLTAELIQKAVQGNYDMIIAHEPTFATGDYPNPTLSIDVKKWEMLTQSEIVVCRFHDYAHNYAFDYIHAGFLKGIGLHVEYKYERESLGVCRYILKEELTVREMAKLIEEKVGVEFVRVVGDSDAVVKTVALGLGGVGLEQVNILMDPGCDLFITGEVDEVCTCQYINDACYFGEKKAIFLLGHCSSEYLGMRLLAEELNKNLIEADYLHCGEVYRKV